MTNKILITGASGFIGSFIVEEALNRDMEVWAAVRKTTSRRYLKDKRINFIELDFNSKDELKRQLADHQFDYIVHAAGVTKCIDKADFRRMNTDGTRNLVDALIELQMPLKRFVFLSACMAPYTSDSPIRTLRRTTVRVLTLPTDAANLRPSAISTL